MTSVLDYLKQAELSLASYATLTAGRPNQAELRQAGMSSQQAADFAQHWRVITQYTPTEQVPLFDSLGNIIGYAPDANGLSATVFEEVVDGVPSGQRYLAVRGTEATDIADLTTDAIDIALLGSPEHQAQYKSLKAKVQEWMGNATLPSSFTVTGHSLGGFLAGALTVDFPTHVSHAYLYNAPGVGGIGASLTQGLGHLLGLSGQPSLDLSLLSNLRATTGASPISGLGVAWGTPIPVIIEDQFLSDVGNPAAARNHSQQPLTDALSLYAAFSQLDAALTIDQIGGFLKSASVYNNRTLEYTLDALRRGLLGNTVTATPISNRDTFYSNLQNLQSSSAFTALAGKVTVSSSTGLSVAQARNNFGAFLALQTLSPFVLSPQDTTAATQLKSTNEPLAQAWEADAQLTSEQRVNGQAHFSDLWLADRAAMLGWLNVSGTQDQLSLDSPDDNSYVFTDVATKRNVQLSDTVLGVQITETPRFIRFGGDGADTLKGDNEIDHLYGGAGNDTLIGLHGNDYLEGGQGNDTYKFSTGDGQDQIVDGDGGTVLRNGKALGAGYRSGADEWKGNDGTTYTKDGNNLIIKFGNADDADQITIRNFDYTDAQTEGAETNAADFGISLKAAKLALLPTLNKRNNPAQGDGEVTPTSTTLKEGGLRQMTLFASGVSDVDRTLTLSLANAGGGALDPSHYLISTGADLLNFQNNQITLTLLAGTDSLSFALLTQGDIDTNANLTLNAALGDGSGGTLASTGIDIAFTATVEPNAGTQRTIVDGSASGNHITWAGVEGQSNNPVHNFTGASIDAGGGNDFVSADGLQYTITAGAGNDIVTGGLFDFYYTDDHKTNTLHGGDGDDVIDTGSYRATAYGDAGNDLLEGNIMRGWSAGVGGWAKRNGVDFVQRVPFALFPGMQNDAAIPNPNYDSSPFFGSGGSLWNWLNPYVQVKSRIATTTEVTDGVVSATGGSWTTDDKGNWILGPDTPSEHGANPWGDLSLEGYPAAGSFASWDGSTVQYTISRPDPTGYPYAYRIDYQWTAPDGAAWTAQTYAGFSTYGYEKTAHLTPDGHLEQTWPSLPHTLDGGEGEDTLIAGDGGFDPQGLPQGDTLIGGAGNDLIQGGDGNDLAWGDQGPIAGETSAQAGSDQIALGDGDDYADGGDGNDVMLGEKGSDILFGGRGNDLLIAGKFDPNADSLGNDYLDGEDGNDTVLGGQGADDLIGGSGDDWLQGERTLNATGGSDYLDAGAGDDTLKGGGGDDILIGGAGHDQLDGGLGDDTYVFNPGAAPQEAPSGGGQGQTTETLADAGGNDTIRFGPGIALDDVELSAISGGQILIGYGTDDALALPDATTIERFEFADGSIYSLAQLIALRGDASLAGLTDTANSKNGTGADDTLSVTANTTVNPGRGNDSVTLAGSDNTYRYTTGDGTDHITVANNSNLLQITGATPEDLKLKLGSLALQVGDNPENTIHIDNFDPNNPEASGGFGLIQFLDPATGQVMASTSMLALLAQGFEVEGTDGNDVLTGTAVMDRMTGFDGNDTLNGGAGDDMLYGGSGDDVFLIGRTSGSDTLDQSTADAGDRDVIRFASDVLPTDVLVTSIQGGVKLSIRNTTASVTVPGWNEASTQLSVEFADGTTWDAVAVQSLLDAIRGTPGNDTLNGTAGDDRIVGFAGNDTLIGAAGNDRLDGGTGDDALRPNSGNDTVVFGRGSGHDTLFQNGAPAGDLDVILMAEGVTPEDIVLSRTSTALTLKITDTGDTLAIQGTDPGVGVMPGVRFADGTVWSAAMLGLTPYDPIVGTEANDSLLGGNAPESIRGMGGNDFLFGGGGNDTLDGGVGNDALRGGAGNDVYVFGRGSGNDTLDQTDTGSGDADVIRLAAGLAPGDITLYQGGGNYSLRINDSGESLTVLVNGDASALPLVEFADGTVWGLDDWTDAPSLIIGSADGEELGGTAGKDAVFGLEGNDDIAGDSGDDLLDGGNGDDFLGGGTGNDVLLGQAGDDRLNGGSGDDALDGGEGNDTYIGGTGDDVFVFGRGSGNDSLDQDNAGEDDVDTILLGEDLTPDDVSVSSDEFNYYLSINDTGETIDIFNDFEGEVMPSVRFGDGSTWTLADLAARGPTITGSEDDDEELEGGDTGDRIYGLSGNDGLWGWGGDDTLDGGADNDLLVGGSGNDVFLFGRGSGFDTLNQASAWETDEDHIHLGEIITPEDVTVIKDEDGFRLVINDTEETLTVSFSTGEGALPEYEWVVPAVEFADGSVWSLDSLAARGQDITGSEAVDELTGTPGNDTIHGLGGDDELVGNGGNDTLTGGAGNDWLSGGTGNDVYIFSPGDGQDTINQVESDFEDHDVVRFSSEVAPEDVALSRSDDDLVLSLGSDGDRIRLGSWFSGENAPAQVAAIEFADGTVWDAEMIMEAINGSSTVEGGTGNDTLSSDAGNTTFIGGAGNDMLTGSGGGNTYVFNVGDGIDHITDTSKADGFDAASTVQFGAGITPEDISLDLGSLLIHVGSGGDAPEEFPLGDAIHIEGFDPADPLANPAIDYFVFADGSELSFEALLDKGFDLKGTAGDNDLVGTAVTDRIQGLSGADALTGGAGDDLLSGGAGSDTYHFFVGDGNDTVSETTAGEANVLAFGTGIAATDLSFEPTELGLVVHYGTGDSILVAGYDGSEDMTVRFADATAAPLAKLADRAPQAGDPLAQVNATEDAAFSYTVPAAAFADTDLGDHLSYAATRADGSALPAWLAFDAATRTFSGTPVNADVGMVNVKLTATDRYGKSATQTLPLMVINTNDAPTLGAAIADVGATQDMAFTWSVLTNAFADVDVGDRFTYAATMADGSALPAWLAVNTASGDLSGTPPATAPASLALKLTATDSGGISVTAPMTLRIGRHVAGTGYGDTQTGTADNDWIEGKLGNDAISGGDGDDLIDGGAGSDVLAGGNGNDSFTINGTDAGYDSFQGDAGFDQVLGGASDDTIRMYQFTGAKTVERIDGGAGSNVIAGTGYGDTLDFSATELLNIAKIDGGDGNDTISGSAGNDVIAGDKGSDVIAGGAGDDTFAISGTDSGYDSFQGDAGFDQVLGGAGDDTIRMYQSTGVKTVERIDGAGGTNVIAGTGYGDTLDLSATELLNIAKIDGGDGNDTIIGSAGNDTIFGGIGSDVLAGGAGDDTFRIDGTDTGYDSFEGDAGFDQVQGGAGDDTIRMYQFTGVKTVERIDGGTGVNVIAGTGYGDTLDMSGTELLNIAKIDGGDGNDTMTGSAGADTIVGGMGSDVLAGGAGDDAFVIDGTDTGYDSFQGDAGFDRVLGGAGDDTIRMYQFTGIKTVERIDGGAGVNVIAGTGYGDMLDMSATELLNIAKIDGGDGNDTITGSAGADTIVGGTGSDVLAGGAGDDIFRIDGVDSGYDSFEGDAGFDQVLGGASDDTVRMYQFTGVKAVERIDGGAGVNVIAGTGYGDTLDMSTAELVNIARIDGGDGNDVISGSAGDDFIAGGTGSDTLRSGAGINVLSGQDGNDLLTNQGGSGVLSGGAGIDALNGNTSSELFIGGTGNDTLNTGAGADVIAFNAGDGQDILVTDTTRDNTISLGGGIAYAGLALTKNGNDLVLETGGTDQITLKNWYAATPTRGVLNLQVIAEAMAGFSTSSSDPLLNKNVQNFNFQTLVEAYDTARASNATLVHWGVMNRLLDAHLAGADDAALGGDLAYQYGRNGNLANVGVDGGHAVLASNTFGVAPQMLQSQQALQQGVVRLG